MSKHYSSWETLKKTTEREEIVRVVVKPENFFYTKPSPIEFRSRLGSPLGKNTSERLEGGKNRGGGVFWPLRNGGRQKAPKKLLSQPIGR